MSILPHPATLELLKLQSQGKFSRTIRRLRQPRRLLLSALAFLLAITWLGQTVMAICFREATDPARLHVWIPLSLLAYSLWHIMKAACRAPVEPFEWTSAEQELLGGAPLQRKELVKYRLTSIVLASVAKAACFSLVMLPDLHVWFAGFAGMLLGLIFIDLLRMGTEIIAYGLSRPAFIRFRVAVLGIAGSAITAALISTLCTPNMLAKSQRPIALDLGVQFFISLAELRTTLVGVCLEMPFRVFSQVILAKSLSASLVGFLFLSILLTVGCAQAVLWLDRYFYQRRIAAERKHFRVRRHAQPTSVSDMTRGRNRMWIPVRLRGAGGLAWRQALGALQHSTSLCISLLVPGILCCLVLLRPQTELTTLLQVVAGLVFYSFLLLPTALKFDFRKDLDRLTVIKSLPISATAATFGQLTTPIALAMIFQVTVLTITILARPFHVTWFMIAVASLIPINLFIFALENLIFMLYPYRLQEEGLGVFLRSILTFTGKGILFATALALTLAWGLISKQLGVILFPESGVVAATTLFASGMWLFCGLSAVTVTGLLVRAYHRFDPSTDLPALT